MSRFNTTGHRTKPPVALTTSPIATTTTKPDTRTFEGGAGWTRTPQGELFLMASGALQDGKNDFYESGKQRDDRLRQLVGKVAAEDPQWMVDFATWLRGPGNMRTAALMIAVDFVHERLATGATGDGLNRKIINAVCQRADEPGELLAFWTQEYGRKIPKPVKRGLADAVRRLYNQYGLLKYDTPSKGYRFGDVLNLIHAAPRGQKSAVELREERASDACPRRDDVRALATFAQARRQAEWVSEKEGISFRPNACVCGWFHITRKPRGVRVKGEVSKTKGSASLYSTSAQGDLFQHALDRRYGNVVGIPESLTTLHANFALREDPRLESWLNPEFLRKAGMTWEDALSAVGSKVDKAKLWEALIPSMGIMAQIRNLRNFDQAGVSDKIAQQVITRITDPEQIAKSRQFPFRFLSAYRATENSLRWAYALEQALNHSLANVPSLGGRTLILVDRSPSMFPNWSGVDSKTGMSRADQAAIFGGALALRAEKPTLVWFGGASEVVTIPQGISLLKLIDFFGQSDGTDIPSAIKKHYANHDRVVVITDEQTRPGYFPSNMQRYGGMSETSIDALIPLDVPVYMWNLAGYTASAMASGSNARFTLGGLTDSAFRLIPMLESGAAGVWPWQLDSQAA